MENSQRLEQRQEFELSLIKEFWKVQKGFANILEELDEAKRARYENQYRFFVKRITQIYGVFDYKVVNLEGEIFDVGMPITPLNIEEFATEEILVIKQMIEPIIIQGEQVLQLGVAILERKSV